MPKKVTKYVQVQESASSTTAVVGDTSKCHRSVLIGPRNGRRWLSLKKRLGLLTDDDLIVYLLDLADSISVRKDENCIENAGSWKMACTQKKETLTITDTKSSLNIFHMEVPRRSLRKLATSDEISKNEKSEKIERLANISNNLDTAQSDLKLYSKSCSRINKIKRHKNKARHHKDKRKKKRHQKTKDLKDIINIENKETRNIPWEFDSGSDAEKISADMPENYISSTTVQQTLKNSNSLDSKTILTLQKSSYNLNEEMCSDINKTDKSINNFADATCNERELKIKTVQNYSTQILEVKNNSNKHNKEIIKMNLLKPDKVSIIHSQFSSNKKCLENVEYLNKKNKHPKLKSSESCKVLIELDKDYSDELSSLNKHDKKRHKADNQQNKKQDVRKAPQDGIIITKDNQDFVSCSNDLSMTPIIHNVPDNNILPSEVITENNEVETQKLAIKIKLCQICNTRHLQDICPLMEPKYIISDSVSLEKWIQKYNKNCEVMKAVDSNDPMCKGYHKNINNGFESEEELSEQFKSKMKKESEEKLQTVDINRPLYAQDSLPDCLELKLSNVDHGLGVFVKSFIPMHTQLGPLIGKTVQEMDIPDDFSMRHIWEVNMNEKKLYISTTNPLISNWIRYIRPAETKDNRNVIVISKNGSLFLVTSKNLIAGTELIYWLDSHSTIWSRKNKIDKTNCGGCNLNFLHPIYYRLHCSIFHDTNYSLTIRKYHCKVCGAAVLGKDNIMKHAAQLHAGRGAYQCQYCKKFFLRLNYLEMHRTYGCSQNPQRSRPLCDFCGRKFCQPQKLKVHIKRMHSDMSEVLREFQCKLCLKLLGSRAALQRHMKEVHHKDVIGAATCDRCGKMFQNKSNLKIHMLTHSGVKPFKCKENGCKAAFTTKQCLQFHYKKVHGLSEDMMPKIERSVAYTFDAYSGGLVEDAGRGKTPKFNSSNTQENSNSLASFDDCSSENNNTPSITDIHNNDTSDKFKETKKLNQHTTAALTTADSSVESIESDGDLYGTSHLPNKSDKKWLGEFNPTSSSPLPTTTTTGIYDFHDNKREEKIQLTNESLIDNSKLNSNLYRKTESASASLLVEAALDAAEREIGAVSSPILEDSDRETNIYSITNELDFKTSCPQNQVIQRSPETHIDSYVQDDLTTSPTLHTRNTPSNHMYLDFHVHRSVDYVNPVNKNHSIDQYLEQQDIQRIIHNSQEVLTSPTRYQEISHSHFHSHSHIYPHSHHQHHQITNDEISSDEGDSVAQNLSLSVKEKNLQHLELIKYDTLESEFGSINRERVRFEPLIVQTVGDQGLDMSARGFQQSFGSQVQNSNIHSHHQHLYEINERERQGVDLSRTSTCISPPQYSLPPYSPYSQVDVSRVVSLEPTRSHSLHNSRIIASPQPTNSLTSHLVSDNLETRTLSSPPPSMPVYNSAYTIGSTSYHSSRSGYHYSGYYQ